MLTHAANSILHACLIVSAHSSCYGAQLFYVTCIINMLLQAQRVLHFSALLYKFYQSIVTVEKKPLALFPVKKEVKEEAATVTKDETTSGQPTGMSSHFITSIVC